MDQADHFDAARLPWTLSVDVGPILCRGSADTAHGAWRFDPTGQVVRNKAVMCKAEQARLKQEAHRAFAAQVLEEWDRNSGAPSLPPHTTEAARVADSSTGTARATRHSLLAARPSPSRGMALTVASTCIVGRRSARAR